jgi:hypothetical protein
MMSAVIGQLQLLDPRAKRYRIAGEFQSLFPCLRTGGYCDFFPAQAGFRRNERAHGIIGSAFGWWRGDPHRQISSAITARLHGADCIGTAVGRNSDVEEQPVRLGPPPAQ